MVIDEIGKMELFSTNFKNAVDVASKKRMLATIPVKKGNGIPFIEKLRTSPTSQVITVVTFIPCITYELPGEHVLF